MKTLLLTDPGLRVSVMSFHNEIVYSVMRAWFESLISQVLIWNDKSYGLLWNTVMVDDISTRVRTMSRDSRYRLYAVLFGVVNLRRELRIVPFRDALEEHMTTGLTVAAVAVMDLKQISETFGTSRVPEDILEDFVNKYNAWHNSFEWFVRLFVKGRLKAENRVCKTMDDVIMWLKHQPELVNVRITPKQFADARSDVEVDFGILMRKTFVVTGLGMIPHNAFRAGAAALRAAYEDFCEVHASRMDPESVGSVFASSDSIVAILPNGIGFTLRRAGMNFLRVTLPAGTPLHLVNGIRDMLTAFVNTAECGSAIAESEDISIQSLIAGNGFVPSLAECHRQVIEAIGRLEEV